MKRSKKKKLLKKNLVQEELNCNDIRLIKDFEKEITYDNPIEFSLIRGKKSFVDTSFEEYLNWIYTTLRIRNKPTFYISDEFLNRMEHGSSSFSACYIAHLSEPIIILRSSYNKKLNFFATIAHELRHLWQDENNLLPSESGSLFSMMYMPRLDYVTQDHEIDAEAFAATSLLVLFGIVVSWGEKSVEPLIRNRMVELMHEYVE